uniref:Membrane integral NOTCH2 associated receptor 1 n=1 Tax=Astyanax mexicanus TaxID=7994 RepID=A0A8B9HD39_ASTMX
MSFSADDPLVLLEILEVLGACRGRVSYADVCVYLSGRYELQPLLELRSLLYSTACRDPCFPATLFRERLHPPCSNRLSAAADVVSLFNLLTHTRLPPSHTHPEQQSQTSCLVCGQGCPRYDWLQEGGGAIAQGSKYEGSTETLISMRSEVLHTQTPSHFHADRTQATPHILNQAAMQVARSVDSECPGNQESSSKGPDTEPIYSCAQKRSMFKGEFHNLLPFVPVDSNNQKVQAQDGFTEGAMYMQHHPSEHSQGPVVSSYLHAPAQEPKHKSMDDLQSSTYFGPTVMERTPRNPVKTAKSHSLDIDCRPEGEDKFGLDKNDSRRPGSERSALDRSGLSKPGLAKLSFDSSSFDIPGFDPFIVRSVRDTLKRLSGLSLDAWYDCSPGSEGMANVGTQTDLPDRRALRSLMLSDKLSIDNPDIGEDDISAIFRFLDDISMCGSMAVLPGEGGGAQEGGGGGLPERRERLGKLRRLFHSLEGPEEGVRWGVGRLLQRVTELEQRLEPISELREQLAQVLATLNRLEQREQLVHLHSQQLCPHKQAAPGCVPGSHQQHGGPRPNPDTEGAEGAAAKRRGMFTRRASRSHTESSGSDQQRDWSVSYSKEQHTHPAQVTERGSPCSQSSTAELHVPESLDFWMDDVYTPASDTLLRRSQTLTRCSRTQTYRITALSITATVILILIIVIPLCTA